MVGVRRAWGGGSSTAELWYRPRSQAARGARALRRAALDSVRPLRVLQHRLQRSGGRGRQPRRFGLGGIPLRREQSHPGRRGGRRRVVCPALARRDRRIQRPHGRARLASVRDAVARARGLLRPPGPLRRDHAGFLRPGVGAKMVNWDAEWEVGLLVLLLAAAALLILALFLLN